MAIITQESRFSAPSALETTEPVPVAIEYSLDQAPTEQLALQADIQRLAEQAKMASDYTIPSASCVGEVLDGLDKLSTRDGWCGPRRKDTVLDYDACTKLAKQILSAEPALLKPAIQQMLDEERIIPDNEEREQEIMRVIPDIEHDRKMRQPTSRMQKIVTRLGSIGIW